MTLAEKCRHSCPSTVEYLRNSLLSGRFGHSYLVSSDSAEMRREAAGLIAQFAACPEPVNGMPCGVCRVCREIESESYPELYILSPQGKRCQIKVGDGDGEPDPNTVRWFENCFHLTRGGPGRSKVGIITDAECMNDAAQNALLKTLEEPPRESVLVLSTGKPASLLPTIRSRCRMVWIGGGGIKFSFSGFDELAAALNTIVSAPDGDVRQVSLAADSICAVAGSLNAEAEAEVRAKWSRHLENAARSEDPVLIKKAEQQVADACYGAYALRRNEFLSAVHTFAAELFQLSCGVEFGDLANPELFPSGRPSVPDRQRAAGILREAEELLAALRFQVSEELALRAFCYNAAFAGRDKGKL